MSFDDFLNQEGGGGINDYEITVTNAFFAVDEPYSAKAGAPHLKLHWEGTTDVEGHEQMTRESFHPSWILDPDWITMDGGKTVVSQSGKGKLGKATGRMMASAARAVEDAGMKDSPENPFNQPGADPKHAATWIGTRWFMTDVTREYGNGMSSTDQLPTKFLGTGAAPAAAPAAPAAPAAAPAPVAPAPAPAAAAPASDPNLRAQVVALAQSAPDFGTFSSQAMMIPGVTADLELVKEITNPQGIFATKA